MEATGGGRDRNAQGDGGGTKVHRRKGEFLVPFDDDGNLIWWYDPIPGVEWRPNDEFEDTLRFEGFERRQVVSVIAHARFRSVATGASYPMFMADFADAIRRAGFTGDRITGRWAFVKRGWHAGVRLVAPTAGPGSRTSDRLIEQRT